MKHIYQLKISLNNFSPLTWRRIWISSNTLLEDLHLIIQTCMGWDNLSSYLFISDSEYYSPDRGTHYIDFDSILDTNNGFIDVLNFESLRIKDIINSEKKQLTYEYLSKTKWDHTIHLEEIFDNEILLESPICLEGENHTPFEDCEDIESYNKILEILNNSNHPHHKDYSFQYNKEHHLSDFDKDLVNALLKEQGFGVFDLIW